jgi:methylated-DNA-[protein]-cysteine S-methyltransferase
MVLLNFLYFESPIGIMRVEYAESCLHSVRFVSTNGDNHTDDAGMEKMIQADLHAYFQNPEHRWESPIAMHLGTEFQEKVWLALRMIPAGEARSYQEIAQLIGQPNAAQAVGKANSQNPLLLRIPCHRVIGSDGSMVGYAGELWRKEWLLTHEGFEGVNQQMTLFADGE